MQIQDSRTKLFCNYRESGKWLTSKLNHPSKMCGLFWGAQRGWKITIFSFLKYIRQEMFSGSGQKWTKKLSGQHTSRRKMPVLKLVNSIRMWVADNDNKKFLLMYWGNYLSVQAKGGASIGWCLYNSPIHYTKSHKHAFFNFTDITNSPLTCQSPPFIFSV